MTTIEATKIDKVITVGEIAGDIRSARVIILTVMFGLGVIGALVGHFREKQYEATVVVMAVSGDSSRLGSLGALASQYGDLASIAGLTTPGASRKNEAVAVLQSELLTEAYLKAQNLLPILFDQKKTSFFGMLNDAGKAPTLWKGNRYFKSQIRSVNEDKSTGLITLKIKWKDPRLASKWANDLVSITNTYLKDKAIREAERNIAYLKDQESKTTIVEARQAINSLLKNELDNEMVARGREEFALKVIDPAFPPEKPATFGTIALAAFGLGGGLIFSVLFLLGRQVLRNTP
jgi:uncharacterized protein involved in exopolysaccharide biosynthesis